MVLDLLSTGVDVINKDVNNKWEQHLNYIKKTDNYKEVTIETAAAYADSFDLYARFTKMDIPERYHYVLMRLNGFKSPTDYTEYDKKLKIYEFALLESLYLKITS